MCGMGLECWIGTDRIDEVSSWGGIYSGGVFEFIIGIIDTKWGKARRKAQWIFFSWIKIQIIISDDKLYPQFQWKSHGIIFRKKMRFRIYFSKLAENAETVMFANARWDEETFSGNDLVFHQGETPLTAN